MQSEQTDSVGVCPWLCGGPNYPSTPFTGPVFLVADTFRIGIAIGALILVLVSVWAICRSETQGQKTRFAFAAMLCITVFGTEIEHLGDWPHWRFLINGVGVTLGLWGYYQHLFHELPARDRATRDDRLT